MSSPPMDRRRVLRGAAALGVGGAAAGVLAACGNDARKDTAPPASAATSSPADQPSSSPGADGQQALVAVADVPVGGGVIVADPNVVVTQPEQGTLVAFGSICTHQGCPVAEVVDGAIVCACHGSRFAVADGSVLQGPAAAPLPPQPVKVRGGSVFLA